MIKYDTIAIYKKMLSTHVRWNKKFRNLERAKRRTMINSLNYSTGVTYLKKLVFVEK